MRFPKKMISTFFIFQFLLMAILYSCNRIKDDKTTLFIHIPENNSVIHGRSTTTSTIEHITVNVTGDNMSGVFWSWDCHQQDATQCTPPNPITLVVPTGANRLAQVLVVKKTAASTTSSSSSTSTSGSTADSSTDKSSSEVVYYGDTTANLINASETLTITVQQLATLAGKQIKILGRFLTAPDTGPTGSVYAYVELPNKPRLRVISTTMINGWFDFFAVDGIPFTYTYVDPSTGAENPIFERISASSSIFTGSNQVMRVHVPNYYRVQWPNGTPQAQSNTSGEDIVVGFFGGGVSNEVVCYQQATEAIQLALNGAPNVTPTPTPNVTPQTYSYGLFVDAAGTTPLQWKSTFDASHLSLIGGGVSDAANCSSGKTPYVDAIIFKHKAFGQFSDSATTGVSGVLTLQPADTTNAYDFPNFIKVKATPNSGGDSTKADISVNWSTLPNLVSKGLIDGVSLIGKTYTLTAGENIWNRVSTEINSDNGYSCLKAANNGYKLLGSTTTGQVLMSAFPVANLNSTFILACPIKGPNFLDLPAYTSLNSIFLPPSIPSNYPVTIPGSTAWYPPATFTPDVNNKINQWSNLADPTTSIGNVLASSPSVAPVYSATDASFNNLSSASFTGTQSMAVSTLAFPSLTSGYTIVAAVNPSAGGTSATILNVGTMGSSSGLSLLSSLKVNIGNYYVDFGPNTFGSPQIVVLRYVSDGTAYVNTSNLSLFVNGTPHSSIGSTVPNSFSPTLGTPVTTIGNSTQTASNYYGTMGEIIVYNRDLTNTELSGVQCYLSKKFNITLGYTCP